MSLFSPTTTSASAPFAILRAAAETATAYSYVAGLICGPWLFSLVNLTLIVANIGSGMGSQLASAPLFGMGGGALARAALRLWIFRR